MAILVNNTARLIIIGGRLFIPRKPVVDVDVKELSRLYPEIRSMLKSGLLVEKTKRQAVKLDADFEEAVKPIMEEAPEATTAKGLEDMDVGELKDYAEKRGIKLGRANKRDAILSAIRKAGE